MPQIDQGVPLQLHTVVALLFELKSDFDSYLFKMGLKAALYRWKNLDLTIFVVPRLSQSRFD
jgi:hypothetical protein